MSRTGEKEFQNTSVLVRAFGDEPVVLSAEGFYKGLVELRTSTSTVLFPKEDVYELDPDLLGQLRTAFAEHDRSALNRLWSGARAWGGAVLN